MVTYGSGVDAGCMVNSLQIKKNKNKQKTVTINLTNWTEVIWTNQFVCVKFAAPCSSLVLYYINHVDKSTVVIWTNQLI